MTLSSIIINTIGTVLLTSFVVTILNQSVVINTITTTNQPSIHPTYQPSIQNTTFPSIIPTIIPTSKSSNDPSLIPTILPTSSLTNNPTVDPTSKPTQCPSSLTTIHPTVYSTSEPSNHPSSNPTIKITVTPSIITTASPSSNPSNKPSCLPSINPSNKPSSLPSINPSNKPSSLPSINPSPNPSIKPSIYPTYNPSLLPTRLPTSLQPNSVNTATASPSISNHPASPPITFNPISNLISNSSHPICTSTYGSKPIASKLNTCTAYNVVKTAFNNLLPISTDILARGKLFGKVVRLVYHDAVEIDIRTPDLLGSDGCLSEKSDNAGLLEPESLVLTVLEPLWQEVCGYISRADYWVMFAILVLGEATSNQISINYQFGREDNLECDIRVNRLPGGQSGIIDIHKIFTEQMGLTIYDAGNFIYVFLYIDSSYSLESSIFIIVALLGGHSLGHTNTKVSGYGFTDLINPDPAILNAWDTTPHILDNEYYIELTQKVL